MMIRKILSYLGATISVFFCFTAIANAQPAIFDISINASTSSADIYWGSLGEKKLTDSFLEYGYSEIYGATGTIQAAEAFSTSGHRYFFAGKIKSVASGERIFYRLGVVDVDGIKAVATGNFNTLGMDSEPPQISRVSVVAGVTNATISWYTNERTTGKIIYYTTNGKEMVKNVDDLATEHHVFLGALQAKTIYDFQIDSVDIGGNRSTSAVKNFTTASVADTAADVSDLKANLVSGGVSINWHNPVSTVFDRVKLVRSVSGPAGDPGEGELLYEGRAQGYLDKGNSAGRGYYYTVFTLNISGQPSGGATVIFGTASSGDVPVATVTSSMKVDLGKFKFYINKRSEQIYPSGDTFTANPGSDLSIGINVADLPLAPESVVLVINKSELHQLALRGADRSYFADFLFPQSGENPAYIKINYANGLVDVVSLKFNGVGKNVAPVFVPDVVAQVEEKKPGPSPEDQKSLSLKQISETVSALKEFSTNEQVQQTVNTVVAPTVAGAAAASAITAVSWANILPFFQMLFQPLLLLGSRKKRSSSGFVYDSLSKLPVDLATVRIINAATGQLVQSKVTGKDGRFFFVVNPGAYRVQVMKNGYIFPAPSLLKEKDDGPRSDIYHGAPIEITANDAVIGPNIPVDKVGAFSAKPCCVWLKRLSRSVQLFIGWFGLAIIVASLFLAPRWYTTIFLIIQIISLFMVHHVTSKTKIKNWGVVFDMADHRPIPQVMVRLFNARVDRLVASQATDSKGRYYFLAGDDEYYLTFDHAHYQPNKTLVSTRRKGSDESVAIDVGLSVRTS